MNVPIYQQVLGAEFPRLQPELQEYFSLVPGSGQYIQEEQPGAVLAAVAQLDRASR